MRCGASRGAETVGAELRELAASTDFGPRRAPGSSENPANREGIGSGGNFERPFPVPGSGSGILRATEDASQEAPGSIPGSPNGAVRPRGPLWHGDVPRSKLCEHRVENPVRREP